MLVCGKYSIYGFPYFSEGKNIFIKSRKIFQVLLNFKDLIFGTNLKQ